MSDFKPQELSTRVLDDLKKRSTIGIVFYLIAISIVLFSGGYYERHPSFSNQLLFSVFSICLFRLLHMALDRCLPQGPANTAVFLASVVLTALIWGVGFARIALQQGELYTQLMMLTCTIGLCSGGVVAFIPNLRLALTFNLCIMVPGIICYFLLTRDYPLGLLLLLFFVYMIFMTFRQNKEYWIALDNEAVLEKQARALIRLSNRDSLTNLYNRRYFNRSFSFEWKRAQRKNSAVFILLFDVDFFKRINDQYGHIAGDEFLKMVTAHIKNVFKRETDVVARYGGEEFVVLLPEQDLKTVLGLAETVRDLVESTPLEFGTHSIATTMSAGLAHMVPQPGMDKEVLLSRADKALYSAKNSGRNKVCLYASD